MCSLDRSQNEKSAIARHFALLIQLAYGKSPVNGTAISTPTMAQCHSSESRILCLEFVLLRFLPLLSRHECFLSCLLMIPNFLLCCCVPLQFVMIPCLPNLVGNSAL